MAGMFERIETVDLSLMTRARLESVVDDIATLESFLAAFVQEGVLVAG